MNENTQDSRQFDVIVLGDEVESILTAVSAARLGVKTALVRKSRSVLGGLSTRGGLSYMDITPEYMPPLFREFLSATSFKRVALEKDEAHKALNRLLNDARVQLLSGPYHVHGDPATRTAQVSYGDGSILNARVLIDATPDADAARKLELPFIKGLGGILPGQNYLGISPVFRIRGVDYQALQAFEQKLRERPEAPELLAHALPHHAPELRAELLKRPTFAPEDSDYLDILNPLIGIDFHRWRYKTVETYPLTATFIDGANISRLPDDTLGFNGLIHNLPEDPDPFDTLLAYSHGKESPAELTLALSAFEDYLQKEAGFKNAEVIPPEELYVRQTLTLLARNNMTAKQALDGGVPVEKAIGTYSYWLDLRGTQVWQHFPGLHFPKPVFNVGLEVCLPLWPQYDNLGFVSRSAGYSPLGQGTGRIVQHNAMVGEGLGIAAALAVLNNTSLEASATDGIMQVKRILDERNGSPIGIEGKPTWQNDALKDHPLIQADEAAVSQLREALAIQSRLL